MRFPLPAALSALVALISVCAGPACAQSDRPQEPKPNFVILLIDDAAFMDLGVYGGEARTPNIDALAARGMMFTRYYTSPLCAPSRAMLLTGIDNHRTGVATIPEVLPAAHVGQPGYTMRLEPGVMTIAERLKPLGYRTLLTGKWHLGSDEGDLPSDHGFDRSFALDASGADNWEDKPYMPYYREAPWFEDGAPADLPDDFYSSEFIVDQMIRYLDGSDGNAPFLAFLGFQAVHIPVQAPAEFTANYDGVYDEGWDELRTRRWQRARSLGLIPDDAALKPFPPGLRAWDSLSPDEQALYAARMQVNAGMLEAMDHHIGRLIEHLEASGDLENTVFIVTSDNGPEPTRGDDDARLKLWMRFHGYHLGADGIGERGSYGFIGPEWAMAASSPGDLFKFHGSEGGIHVPLIMSGPGLPQGVRSEALVNVTDLTPTLLEMAGDPAPSPGTAPMTGRSMMPLLSGQSGSIYSPQDPIGIEVSGNSALIRGDYKLTRNQKPYGDARWRLYNIATDPGETRDLSTAQPAKMSEMLEAYALYSDDMGVLAVPDGYDSHKQLKRNILKRQLKSYWWVLVLGVAGLLALIWGVWAGAGKLLRSGKRQDG